MKGQPPKSIAELKVHGTFRPSRHGHRELEPETDGEPQKPEGMNADAEWLWELTIRSYAASGALKELDTAALESCCDLWGKYKAASRAADADPVDKDSRIAVTAYYAAWEKAASKIGLNPIDRRRMQVDGDKKKAGLRTRKRA